MNSEAVTAAIPSAERARATAIDNDALAEPVLRAQASMQGLAPKVVRTRSKKQLRSYTYSICCRLKTTNLLNEQTSEPYAMMLK
jgi:hypothetical protein